MSDVDYVLVGPWWTADAPSLRIPRPDGVVLDVWTAGGGPSLLLVGTTREAGSWLDLLPHLTERFTVHALERSSADERGAEALSPAEIAIVVEALGASFVLCADDDAALVVDAAVTATTTTAAVLTPQAALTSPASSSRSARVRVVAATGSPADDALAVSDALLGAARSTET